MFGPVTQEQQLERAVSYAHNAVRRGDPGAAARLADLRASLNALRAARSLEASEQRAEDQTHEGEPVKAVA